MFAAVEFFEGDVSFKGRVFDYFSAPTVLFMRHEVSEGLPFFTVKIKKYRGRYPFSYASDIMGSLANSVIYPVGRDIPDGCPFKPFRGTRLLEGMLLTTAAKYIRGLRLDPTRQSLIVADKEGIFADKIDSFVPLCARIAVITDEAGRYEECRNRLMEKHGICIHISRSFTSEMKSADFIVSPEVRDIPAFFGGTLIGREKKEAILGMSLVCEGVTLPKEYRRLIPEGFSEEKFACALYEHSGVKALTDLNFNSIHC